MDFANIRNIPLGCFPNVRQAFGHTLLFEPYDFSDASALRRLTNVSSAQKRSNQQRFCTLGCQVFVGGSCIAADLVDAPMELVHISNFEVMTVMVASAPRVAKFTHRTSTKHWPTQFLNFVSKLLLVLPFIQNLRQSFNHSFAQILWSTPRSNRTTMVLVYRCKRMGSLFPTWI